jgi:hypothetical protein
VGTYFVTTKEEVDIRLNTDDFAANLLERWPHATVVRLGPDRAPYTLEWDLEMDIGPLEGLLDSEAPAVVLTGDVRDCAAFALWLRSDVLPTCPLRFYDQEYTADLPLANDTTQEDIIAPYNVSDRYS